VIISVIQVFIHLNVLSQKHSPDVAIDVSHSSPEHCVSLKWTLYCHELWLFYSMWHTGRH